jgi:aspartyl-tRNA(Asn)/glutamyl-tRNA(Gln) amidotransferase subunit A
VRTLLRRDFETALSQCDALVAPVSPTTAFKLGEKVADPLAMYLSDILVTAVNPAGFCGLSVPCGFSSGLPVGLQIIGRPMAEDVVFQIGHAYQQATDWHTRRPPAIPTTAGVVQKNF